MQMSFGMPFSRHKVQNISYRSGVTLYAVALDMYGRIPAVLLVPIMMIILAMFA